MSGTCSHPHFRCLRCGSSGCEQPACPDQGFDHGLCRSCGHIEKVPAR